MKCLLKSSPGATSGECPCCHLPDDQGASVAPHCPNPRARPALGSVHDSAGLQELFRPLLPNHHHQWSKAMPALEAPNQIGTHPSRILSLDRSCLQGPWFSAQAVHPGWKDSGWCHRLSVLIFQPENGSQTRPKQSLKPIAAT